MEIIARKNKHFNLAATFILEGEKVVKPKLSYLPKKLFRDYQAFNDVELNYDELIKQIRFMDVEANNVEELEQKMNKAEKVLLTVHSAIDHVTGKRIDREFMNYMDGVSNG